MRSAPLTPRSFRPGDPGARPSRLGGRHSRAIGDRPAVERLEPGGGIAPAVVGGDVSAAGTADLFPKGRVIQEPADLTGELGGIAADEEVPAGLRRETGEP